MSKTKFEAKVIAEVATFAALSSALYAIRPFQLPYGGAITAGSMVPILWLSLRRGVKVGMFAGAIFGVVALEIDVLLLPYSPITNPVQVLLEYPLAFGLIGVAGFFRNPPSTMQALREQVDKIKTRMVDKKKASPEDISELSHRVAMVENEFMSVQALVGTGIALLLRFFVHFYAGIFFWWWSVPPGWNVAAWSAVYNGSFLTGEFIISAILIYLLVRKGTLKMYL
jgi:thiamine transporter